MRKTILISGLLCALALAVGIGGTAWMMAPRAPSPGTATQASAAPSAMPAAARPSGASISPLSVPVEVRREHADTCRGYNLELQEAAAIQLRIGAQAEAQRLLSMRQNCEAGVAPVYRSAR